MADLMATSAVVAVVADPAFPFKAPLKVVADSSPVAGLKPSLVVWTVKGSEPVVAGTKVGYIVTAVTSSLAIEILAEVAEDKAVVASPVTFPTSGPANPAALNTPD